jgi:hypothetical protein
VFRGSAAVAASVLTPRQLDGRRWHRLFRDVYADAVLDRDHMLAVRGAVLLMPANALITGRSAGHVWGGLEVPPDDPVEVWSPTRFGPVQGIRVTTTAMHTPCATERRGIPICTPAHGAWDMARSMELLDAVGWIDALARRRHLSRADLVAHGALHSVARDNSRCIETLRLADPRAESPPESSIRVALTIATAVQDLAPPVPQFIVLDADGYFIARVDLAWPERLLAIEYDGQWHADRDQLTRDRRRLRALNAAGWQVYPVTRDDLRDVDRLVRNILAVLAARPVVRASGR